MKYYFPIHIDGGNRGCEAIARGTIEILGLKKDEYIGLCNNIQLDSELGLASICTLQEAKSIGLFQKGVNKIRRVLSGDAVANQARYSMLYDKFLDQITTSDVCLITGGDMLCYRNNQLNYIVNSLSVQKKPVVLWGCSFGKENLTPEKKEVLTKFTAITARESLTFDYLVNDLKLKNVSLFPDPAFVLQPQTIELPDYFNGNVLGINISNFVSKDSMKDNGFFRHFTDFIDHVLLNTKLTVVLIPHVFWHGQDDREVCGMVKRSFATNSRVKIFDTEHLNYCQIRYAISKCAYFIGARTHSMISAYSTCTPALALGYSIKSKGIAKDLGLDERLVIDYRSVTSADDLIERFEYLIENKDTIRKRLETIMPKYVKKAYGAKEIIKNLKWVRQD